MPILPDAAVLESRELHNRGFSGAVTPVSASRRTAHLQCVLLPNVCLPLVQAARPSFVAVHKRLLLCRVALNTDEQTLMQASSSACGGPLSVLPSMPAPRSFLTQLTASSDRKATSSRVWAPWCALQNAEPCASINQHLDQPVLRFRPACCKLSNLPTNGLMIAIGHTLTCCDECTQGGMKLCVHASTFVFHYKGSTIPETLGAAREQFTVATAGR